MTPRRMASQAACCVGPQLLVRFRRGLNGPGLCMALKMTHPKGIAKKMPFFGRHLYRYASECYRRSAPYSRGLPVYAKALSARPVHLHVHTHNHAAPAPRPRRPARTLSPPPRVSYKSQATQVDATDLMPIPWRITAARAWAKVSPVVLWLGEAAVFVLGRVNLGFGFGLNYIPFLGPNANTRGAAPPGSPR